MKEATELVLWNKYTIELFNEDDYKIGSSDNNYNYSTFYDNGNKKILRNSYVGIKIYEGDHLLSDCLLSSEGGATSLHMYSSLISNGAILICCSNSIFKIDIPKLSLIWKIEADPITCFGIHYLEDDYLVHGELEITRLNKKGEVIWKQSSGDIWVTPDYLDNFEVQSDKIIATNWEYKTYEYDFNGKILKEYETLPINEETSNKITIKKPWWKLW